jgi:hypothetical protein
MTMLSCTVCTSMPTTLTSTCQRSEYRQPAITSLEWVHSKLGNRKTCYNMFRMSPDMLFRLHDLLAESYGLKFGSKSTSIEAFGMFLWMVLAPQSVRQAESMFERSLQTVHSMFSQGVEVCCQACC